MAILLWLMEQTLAATPTHGAVRVGALAALIVAGLIAYGVAAVVLGAAGWRAFAKGTAQPTLRSSPRRRLRYAEYSDQAQAEPTERKK